MSDPMDRLKTLIATVGPLECTEDEGYTVVCDRDIVLLRGTGSPDEPDKRFVARVRAAAELAAAGPGILALQEERDALVAEIRAYLARIDGPGAECGSCHVYYHVYPHHEWCSLKGLREIVAPKGGV